MNTLPPLSGKPSERLFSVDALRGFDMLLIAGGGECIELLYGKTNWAWVDTIALQLKHPAWNGFTFYDFIFPLFLFISGVSIAFSVQKNISGGVTRHAIFKKALRRMILLIILGILDKNTPVTFWDPAQIRVASVLGRIGIAGFFTVLLYMHFSVSKRLMWVAGILLFYYAIIFLVPVPGYGAGNLTFEGNLAGWIDRHFLPGRLLQKTYDENGLLTQLPAVCLCILGSLAGDILRLTRRNRKKLQALILSGIGGIALGLLWSLHFPINKHLWTSSFILLTGGMSFLAIALFYLLIDVLPFKKAFFFFYVIGLNSLTVYLAYRFIDFNNSSKLIFSGLYAPLPERLHPSLEALGAVIIIWLLLYFLYKKKIFLKI